VRLGRIRLPSVVNSNLATCVFYSKNPNYVGIRFSKSKSVAWLQCCTTRESKAKSVHYSLLIHCEIVVSYWSGTLSPFKCPTCKAIWLQIAIRTQASYHEVSTRFQDIFLVHTARLASSQLCQAPPFYFDYAMCHHDIILRLHRLYFNYTVSR
jgi:hypothetical protein